METTREAYQRTIRPGAQPFRTVGNFADELDTVIDRMRVAGWPTPASLSENEHDRLFWSLIIEGLAERYLRAFDLKVSTLISLGPLAATNVPLALDLAGWEGDIAEMIASLPSAPEPAEK